MAVKIVALASEGVTFYNYQEGLAEALTIAIWESGKHKAGVGGADRNKWGQLWHVQVK